jgi:stage III sporulation protein AH
MKTWKRNAVIATVLLLVCAGIYLNWSYQKKQTTPTLTDTLNEQQVMGDSTLVMSQDKSGAVTTAASAGETVSTGKTDAAGTTVGNVTTGSGSDYFAQMRLSRQQSRSSAVDLLEQTISYNDGTQVGDTASKTLNDIVSTSLSESQIESLVIAKGYKDCVAYISDGTISVAVSAPADGLTDKDVALISDAVTSQTDFNLSQLRIIEVKS